jgi:hypothetical protein
MPSPWARGAQFRIIGELHGQTTVNVFHAATNTVIQDGPPLNQLLLFAAQAIADCVVDLLLPGVTSDWRFIAVEARQIFPGPSDPIIVTGVPENVGQLSACSHSISSALLRVRTGTGGRSGRGRMFLPPPGEAEITTSTIDGPTLALLAAFAGCVAVKFMGQNPETEWHIGVLSRKNLTAVGGTFDGAFREAVTLSPVADLAYMGTRRRGRGV